MNKIKLERIGYPFHFVGTDSNNHSIELDAAPILGGLNQGFRPMDLLLISAAGCASIDLLNILQKKRIDVKKYWVELNGIREEDSPKNFNAIEFNFNVEAECDPNVINKTIISVLNKYCSVVKSLDSQIQITYNLFLTS